MEEFEKVDVLISMVGGEHIANQFNITKAIKEARTIKDILFQNIEYKHLIKFLISVVPKYIKTLVWNEGFNTSA